MITPKLPLPVRIALGAGLTILAGLFALWNAATQKKDDFDPNGW